jgi:hypothetical protein
MTVTIADHSFFYPATADELPLGVWIAFINARGRDLDARAAEIDAMPPGLQQHLAAMDLFMARAYAVAAFFAEIPEEQALATFPIQEVARLYRSHFSRCFIVPPELEVIEWDGQTFALPPDRLRQGGPIKFGEILDAKANEQTARTLEWSHWELIQHLAVIFLRPPGVIYTEDMSYHDSVQIAIMANLPMTGALMLAAWYERLNEALETDFIVFQDAVTKSGNYMKKHFSSWGWVNFLKSIAKTKVFDIPGSGLNSIQCARMSSAFDVLMYASEEIGYNEAYEADAEAKNPRR